LKPLNDTVWLRRAIELSVRSRANGNHPFASIVIAEDGAVLAQTMNAHAVDCTCHAEMNAVRTVSATYPPADLRSATLYSSAEPCAMCAGGIYWSGIGRVVYGLSEARLLELTGNHPENPTLSLPCREVLARGQRAIEVVGPLLEDEAAKVHEGFWSR
jgi:tRNA(Arg) A34 adenosine deaminase TadA